ACYTVSMRCFEVLGASLRRAQTHNKFGWRGVSHMTMITIPLSDERLAQLRTWAAQTGLSPEEFLRRRVDQLLEAPDEQFRRAAAYVLEKNAELYRRLA